MKFSKYNLIENINDGLIVFNARISSYIKITKENLIEHFNKLLESSVLDENDELVQYLFKLGYIVDDEIDEFEEVKNKIEAKLKEREVFFTALLYTTEQCNFRCIYCPEDHVDKKFSEENWEALYKYIEKNVKNNTYKNIKVNFFGGEPLLELNAIFNFLDKIEELKQEYPDVVFKYEMTTNGYLLTPGSYDKLTKYNVLHYQITLDGFAEVHDKTRPLVNGNGTWDKIIENLKYINSKEDNVTINFRTNVSPLNQDTVEEFVTWAMDTFNNKKFTFSTEAVSDSTDNVPEELTFDLFSDEFQRIDTYMNSHERNFEKEKIKPLRLLGCACRYADKNCFTITTDGYVSKCGESGLGLLEPVGKLLPTGDIEFFENYSSWINDFETKECKECNIYPLCGGRSCLFKKVCSKEGVRIDCEYMQEYKQIISKSLREGYLG